MNVCLEDAQIPITNVFEDLYVAILYMHVVYLAVILIWQFGEAHEDHQINCTTLSSHLCCNHGFLSTQY